MDREDSEDLSNKNVMVPMDVRIFSLILIGVLDILSEDVLVITQIEKNN